jgi:primosomal replication protein N
MLDHESVQLEAGHSRKVNVSVPCVAIGPVAERAHHLGSGQGVKVKGFLAARKVNSRSVVLHITEIEIVEDC